METSERIGKTGWIPVYDTPTPLALILRSTQCKPKWQEANKRHLCCPESLSETPARAWFVPELHGGQSDQRPTHACTGSSQGEEPWLVRCLPSLSALGCPFVPPILRSQSLILHPSDDNSLDDNDARIDRTTRDTSSFNAWLSNKHSV